MPAFSIAIRQGRTCDNLGVSNFQLTLEKKNTYNAHFVGRGMLVTRGGLAVKRKCTDGDSFRMRLLAAACAINVLHIAAVADTYYWLPERGVKAEASDLSNWSIEFDSEAKAPVADAHPTRMPTASDELCATRDFHFDFNGESLAFKSMNAAAISPYTGILYWGERGEGWTFENGSLSVENLTQRIRTGDSMLLTNGMHLTCSQLFSPGNGMGPDGICDIDIADGCALVAAKTAFANGHIHVAEGGSFSTELLQNSGAQNSCVLENRGLTEFGRIDIASTAPASYGVTIRQLSGTMTFGGQVSRNGGSGGLALEMSGGSVRASGDVCFDDVGSAVAVAGSTIGAIVDDGCVMHMGEFTYGDGVTLRKMGKGELGFGNATPSSLVVAEGALHAIGAGEYGDYISVEPGGELRFRTPGISCTAFAFQNGAKCSIDIGNFPLGSTILQCKSKSPAPAWSTSLHRRPLSASCMLPAARLSGFPGERRRTRLRCPRSSLPPMPDWRLPMERIGRAPCWPMDARSCSTQMRMEGASRQRRPSVRSGLPGRSRFAYGRMAVWRVGIASIFVRRCLAEGRSR